MMTVYSFIVRDPSGSVLAHMTPNQFQQFSFEQELNAQGNIQLKLATALESSIAKTLAVYQSGNLDGVIEMYRRPQRSTGEFGDMVNYEQFILRHEQDDYSNLLLSQTTIAPTAHHLLSRPMIYPPGPLPLSLYYGRPAGTNVPEVEAIFAAGAEPQPTHEYYPEPTDPFVEVDTAQQMLNLVAHCKVNTPSPLLPVSMAPATSGGIVDHRLQLAYEANLLNTLGEMSDASWYANYYAEAPSAVDFGLEYIGVNQWLFRPYVGGYGEDRRLNYSNDPIIFSINRANVSGLSFTYDRLKEVSRVLVGGKTPEKRDEDEPAEGEEQIRDLVIVNSWERQQDSPWNVNEIFHNASKIRGFKDGGVLDAYQEGGRIFREEGIALSFTITVPISTEYVLGIDYDLGTLVTLFIDGLLMDVQVYKVKVTVTPTQGETVTLSVRTLDSRAKSGASVYWRIVDAIESAKEKLDYVAVDTTTNGAFPKYGGLSSP